MARHERNAAGSVATKSGAASSGEARDNTVEAKFWASHRGGPFLFHKVGDGCEPQTNDNAGYLDNPETLIEQGFAPCPKCLR